MGEDIAQIETMIGKTMPMNAALGAQVLSGLSSAASKVEFRYLTK